MSIPSHCTMGKSGTYPVCPIYHMHVCMYPYAHPVPLYRGKEWNVSRSVPFTMCMYVCIYVSLCPFRPIVPWERMGCIPVCPIYHMHVCMYVSLCHSCPIVPWDKMGHTQSVPFTTCMHVCMYPYGHPVPLYHGKEWDVPRSVPFTMCMYVCIPMSIPSHCTTGRNGTYLGLSHCPYT